MVIDVGAIAAWLGALGVIVTTPATKPFIDAIQKSSVHMSMAPQLKKWQVTP